MSTFSLTYLYLRLPNTHIRVPRLSIQPWLALRGCVCRACVSPVRACRCAGATLTRATFTTAGSATTARSRSTPAHSSVPGAPYPRAPSPPKHESMRSAVFAHSTERCDGHSHDPHAHICRDSPTDRAPVSMRDAQSACKPVPAHKKRLQSSARRTAPLNSMPLHVCYRFDSTDTESNHELCSHLPPQLRPPPPWPSHHPKTLKSFLMIYIQIRDAPMSLKNRILFSDCLLLHRLLSEIPAQIHPSRVALGATCAGEQANGPLNGTPFSHMSQPHSSHIPQILIISNRRSRSSGHR